MDGDLGPYDVLERRLRQADEVWMLDFPLAICLWSIRSFGRASMRRARPIGSLAAGTGPGRVLVADDVLPLVCGPHADQGPNVVPADRRSLGLRNPLTC